VDLDHWPLYTKSGVDMVAPAEISVDLSTSEALKGVGERSAV